MKNLIFICCSICLFTTLAQAKDRYWDGYDDAREGQGEWSNNNEYLDGYEDAQRQRQNEERMERNRQEREEQWRREQEQRRYNE